MPTFPTTTPTAPSSTAAPAATTGSPNPQLDPQLDLQLDLAVDLDTLRARLHDLATCRTKISRQLASRSEAWPHEPAWFNELEPALTLVAQAVLDFGTRLTQAAAPLRQQLTAGQESQALPVVRALEQSAARNVERLAQLVTAVEQLSVHARESQQGPDVRDLDQLRAALAGSEDDWRQLRERLALAREALQAGQVAHRVLNELHLARARSQWQEAIDIASRAQATSPHRAGG